MNGSLYLGLPALLLALVACSPRAPAPGIDSASTGGVDGSTSADAASGETGDTTGTPVRRCPEKRIEKRLIVQTDEELAQLEGAAYIQSLLIFRPVSSLEPLRCLEELDEELATGYYQSFPSLEPLANLRRVPYLQLQSTEVDNLTPLRGLEQVEKIDVQFPRATSLAGLESMRSGWVIVQETQVPDLRGLENFEHGMLTLDGNNKLISFAGLASLQSLDSLNVDSNGSLESFETLPKVPIERMMIGYNARLESLAGLEHITRANVLQVRQLGRPGTRSGPRRSTFRLRRKSAEHRSHRRHRGVVL